MSILGIDIGTSGCKCAIYEQDGKEGTSTHRSYNLITNKNGFIELDPNEVWAAAESAIKELTKKHSGSKISALCITSFGESGVLIDRSGKPLYNSILYADPRGENQVKEIINRLGEEEIIRRSGHNPAAMYSAAKLMWLKEYEPEVIENAYKFLQYCGYVCFRLTGEIREDYSLCSRTMMFNVFEKKWDDVLLKAAGLDSELFPEPIQTGIRAGEVVGTVARKLGLPNALPVILGGHDQIAATVGCGVLEPGTAANGMGSVDCITPVFGQESINFEMQKHNYGCVPFVIDNHYVTYAFNFGGGSLLKWYKENFGRESFEKMSENMCEEPTGILVMPHIMGAATPYMDTGSTCAVVGLGIDTDRYTFYKAMMEGIAFEAKINIDCLAGSVIKVGRLRACGGGSRSQARLQINADVLGLPIDVLETEEAGTLGAAIIAETALGVYPDIKDSAARLVKVKKTICPRHEKHLAYMEIYEKYKRMYEGMRYINRKVNRIEF